MIFPEHVDILAQENSTIKHTEGTPGSGQDKGWNIPINWDFIEHDDRGTAVRDTQRHSSARHQGSRSLQDLPELTAILD